MARNTQQIFNKVIKDGFYSETQDQCMCLALVGAQFAKSSTSEERLKAKTSIRNYLGKYGLLRAALKDNGLPCDFAARLAIYKAWKRRPLLTYTIE